MGRVSGEPAVELAHDRPGLIVVSAVRGCLGEIAERPATHHVVIGRVAWLEQSSQLVVGVCVAPLSKR